MSATQLTRIALWPAAAAAGAVTSWLILSNENLVSPDPELTAALGLFIGLAWCLGGLVAWRRRPGNRVGPLMLAAGFAFFASGLQYAPYSGPFTVGLLFDAVYIAVFAQLLLSFPSGRLQSWLDRVIVVGAYVDVALLVPVTVFFDEAGCPCGPRNLLLVEPRNLLLVEPNAALAEGIADAARGSGLLLSLTAIGLLAIRWRRSSAPRRRVLGPVLWTGVVAVAAGAVSLANELAGEPLGASLSLFWYGFAAVPLGFLAGVLRSRLDRGAVAELLLELGSGAGGGRLRDALARILHDPSLSIAYWLPDRRHYVDVDGHPVDLPGDSQRLTAVERDGRPIAVLVHDPSLAEDRELVEAAGAAAALALENDRLAAELRARLEELRASRARIVEAADAERRRIERNLHDATQQRLVSISMALGLAESKLGSEPAAARTILEEARSSLGQALAELRELSQGIHPSILTERGLMAAIRELSFDAAMPVHVDIALDGRLPEPVEAAAYYLVAESLANVAKHAGASAAWVEVSRANGRALVEVRDDGVGGADPAGFGLRGLADRVEALGGTLVLESLAGRGTRVRAEIPCE
jgi:signal transduction histidine kinase